MSSSQGYSDTIAVSQAGEKRKKAQTIILLMCTFHSLFSLQKKNFLHERGGGGGCDQRGNNLGGMESERVKEICLLKRSIFRFLQKTE